MIPATMKDRNERNRDETPWGAWPVLFPARASRGERVRRLLFLALWVAVAAALAWPTYPAVAGGFRPQVLGLPWSFAWVILNLLVMFVALLLLHRADKHDPRLDEGLPTATDEVKVAEDDEGEGA